jgi:hypothetical protein
MREGGPLLELPEPDGQRSGRFPLDPLSRTCFSQDMRFPRLRRRIKERKRLRRLGARIGRRLHR